jgi:hypothetical protein
MGRRSLDERQPVRMEDADQGPLTGIGRQRPAGEELPALAGAIEGGQQLSALHELELHPRTLLTVTNQVTIVARAKRAAGEADVDRLEQVGLAGSVRPVNDDDARRDGGARVGEIAETAALDCADDGRESGGSSASRPGPPLITYTFSRIGITR